MKSASHHAMGHLLYEALSEQGIQLDRELFVLGNLLPDYLPELILNPHFTLKCQREIHIFTEALAGQPVTRGEQLPPEYALRLGILCHYLTDYFTFAHTPEFRLGLKEHRAYEQRLDDYFRDHYTVDDCTLQNHTFARLRKRARRSQGSLPHEARLSRRGLHARAGCALCVYRLPRLHDAAHRNLRSTRGARARAKALCPVRRRKICLPGRGLPQAHHPAQSLVPHSRLRVTLLSPLARKRRYYRTVLQKPQGGLFILHAPRLPQSATLRVYNMHITAYYSALLRIKHDFYQINPHFLKIVLDYLCYFY